MAALDAARTQFVATRGASAVSVPRLRKAQACIRFRSGRCTPESSSRVISVSRQVAKRSCVSSNVSATRTRASRGSAARDDGRGGAPASRRGSPATAPSPTHSRTRARRNWRSTWCRRRAPCGCAPIMAELERIANHLGDIGAVCNDAAFSMMHAECGILREATLRACAAAFGHRLMMDRIVPGGVAVDLSDAGRDAILALTQRLRDAVPRAHRTLRQHGVPAGPHGRVPGSSRLRSPRNSPRQASSAGRQGAPSMRVHRCRTRRTTSLPVPMALRQEGDVDARVWIRIQEIQASVAWLEAALACDAARADAYLPITAGAAANVEATAVVEGFRGDVLVYVRIGSRAAHRALPSA